MIQGENNQSQSFAILGRDINKALHGNNIDEALRLITKHVIEADLNISKQVAANLRKISLMQNDCNS